VELNSHDLLAQPRVPLTAKIFDFGELGHELASPEGRASARPPFGRANRIMGRAEARPSERR
jgi:hypothetical protein